MSIALVQDTTANHYTSATTSGHLLVCVVQASLFSSTAGPLVFNPPTTTGITWTLAQSAQYLDIIEEDGGDEPCFTGNLGVQTPDGFVLFEDFPRDSKFLIVNESGTFPAKVIVHEHVHEVMIDMGDGKLVTMGHLIKNAEGVDVPAIDVFPNNPRVEFTGTVYNLEVFGEDHHYILDNGVVAHNVKEGGGGTTFTFERGGVAIYYCANAPSIASSVTTTPNVTSSGGTPLKTLRLYEYSGILMTSPVDAHSGSSNGSETPSTVNPGSLTTTKPDLIFVGSIGGSTVGSGYTAGASAGDQYKLNVSAGTIATAYGNTNGLWASVAVAFFSGGVQITGVSATTNTGSAVAHASASPSVSGVQASTAVASVIAGGGVAVATITGVGVTCAVGTVTAGLPIDYGNVVGSSGPIPGSVNSTYFYVRWIGWLTPSVSGHYKLGLNVGDGGDMYVGSQQIVSALGANQSANSSTDYTQSATLELRANVPYPIVVEWQHGAGADYECQALWTPPGGSTEVIPTTALSLTGRWWNGDASQWYPNTWY